MKSYIEFIKESTAMKRLLYSTSPKDPNYEKIKTAYEEEKEYILPALEKYLNKGNYFVTFVHNLNGIGSELLVNYNDLVDEEGNTIYKKDKNGNFVTDIYGDKVPELDLKHPNYERRLIDKHDSKTKIPFVKLNPINAFDTPLGIYAYPLEEVVRMKRGNAYSFAFERPFAAILEFDTDNMEKIMKGDTYNKTNLKNDKEKLFDWLNQFQFTKEYKTKENKAIIKPEERNFLLYMFYGFPNLPQNPLNYFEPFDDLEKPFKQIFYGTHNIAMYLSYGENPTNLKSTNVTTIWNRILSVVLGYDYIVDDAMTDSGLRGEGIIHPSEPYQAIILNQKKLNVVAVIDNREKQTKSQIELKKEHSKKIKEDKEKTEKVINELKEFGIKAIGPCELQKTDGYDFDIKKGKYIFPKKSLKFYKIKIEQESGDESVVVINNAFISKLYVHLAKKPIFNNCFIDFSKDYYTNGINWSISFNNCEFSAYKNHITVFEGNTFNNCTFTHNCNGVFINLVYPKRFILTSVFDKKYNCKTYDINNNDSFVFLATKKKDNLLLEIRNILQKQFKNTTFSCKNISINFMGVPINFKNIKTSDELINIFNDDTINEYLSRFNEFTYTKYDGTIITDDTQRSMYNVFKDFFEHNFKKYECYV